MAGRYAPCFHGAIHLLLLTLEALMSDSLVIERLSKTYPNGTKALDSISMEIPCGMFGLLGPNGAGKSTLMRTIATLQEPDSGSIHLGSLDVLAQKDEVRRRLGYLPQEFGVYPRVSAQDMLDHLATLKGLGDRRQRQEAVAAMLQRVNLYQHRRKALSRLCSPTLNW
jgi:ABC-2 type transport system ATP-binding protein